VKVRTHRSGQAIIIAVLTLGGAILGATTLAGLLLLYQIRDTTDSEGSAQAIFAADAGVNWALYSYFNDNGRSQSPMPGNANVGLEAPAVGSLSNGATITVTCSDEFGNVITCDQLNTTSTAISEGNANGNRRAFFVNLTGATGTLP
jgi:hypothetical protein